MWGYNSNVDDFAKRIDQQWIELYTTGVEIDVGGWKLVFVDLADRNKIPAVGGKFRLLNADNTITAVEADSTEYMVVDTVSNIDSGGWTLARDGSQGQGGTLPSRENGGALSPEQPPHLWIWSPCTVILITLVL